MKISGLAGGRRATWVITAFTLAVTMSAALWSASRVRDTEAKELRARAANARQLIANRIGTYTEVLYGTSGLRRSSEVLTRAEFHRYIASLDLLARYPGFQVIGYAELVRGDLPAFERRVRADAGSSGLPYPPLSIQPPGERPEYVPIVFIEPQVGNFAAFGFDFLSEPNRRTALERARDTGNPAATAPVTLVQETGRQAGFLIMHATYQAGAPLETVEQRRAAFVGVEYAAFRMGDLLAGVLGAHASPHALEIYDRGPVDAAAPEPLTLDRRTYDTDDRAQALDPRGERRTERVSVDVSGRRWDIHYRATEALVTPQERSAPWVIAAFGLLLTVLISWLFWAMSTARERAVALAVRMTAELRDSEQRLARSNAELERFAYVASHDLQEPLRTVSSFVSLLEQRYGDRLDERAKRYIGFAVDGTGRMSRMISELLAYSRVGRGDPEPGPTDLAAAWDEAVANLGHSIEELGARVHRGDLPVVLATRLHAVQLLQNLIGNALKYRSEAAPEIAAEAAPVGGGQEWQVTVRDNGIGIDPKYHERIFVIFQRLHTVDEYPGTGMGLAICKKIVESYGGRIWVESQPGEGTRMCFTLPAVPAPTTGAGVDTELVGAS